MKKITVIIVAVVSFLLTTTSSFSQCPGCAVNNTCHPVGGGLCPDSLPAGTQGVAYDQDITCYLPTTIDAGPFSGGVLGIVPLESMHIDAISGLPFGLNWTCDHPGNNFSPSSGDTLGCVKICGTPISAAGVYNITVSVTAGIDAGALGTQYGQTSFNFQMVLLPNSSGNIAFNYSPTSACDSGLFSFTPNINFGLPQITGYNWDFGGGSVSSVTSTSPITMNFNTPGDYPVTLTTTVYNLSLTDFDVTASSYWWCGDVEETTWPGLGCTAPPDLYFKFTHGGQTYYSSSGSDNTTQIWTNLNVPLSSTSLAINIWDEDNVSADDDGGTAVMTIPGAGVYGYSTVSPWGGGCSGSFTIGYVVDTIITVTDTIHVYASPPAPTVTASSPDYCPGDSVLLTATPGYSYEWYMDDTILLATTTVNELYVSDPGNYSVTVYDLNTGCSSHSASVTVTENPAIQWNFAIQWSVANQWLQSNISGSISYQWQTWDGSAWVNIGAPEGVQSHYTPTGNGEFQLIAMNTFGCSDTAYYNFNTFGVEDQNYVSQVSLYPNPATHSFTLDLKDVKGETVNVSIISMMGQVVYQKEFEVSGGALLQNFDVYEYANGVYTIDIRIGNYNIRKKLIKD
jgi:hypothetical protein